MLVVKTEMWNGYFSNSVAM